MDNNIINGSRHIKRIKRIEFASTRTEYTAGYIAVFGAVVMLVITRTMAGFGLFDSLYEMNDALSEFLISLLWPLFGGCILPLFLYFTFRKRGRFQERFAKAEIKAVAHNLGFRKLPAALLILSIAIGIVYSIANTGIATVTHGILINLGFRLRGGGGEVGGVAWLFVSLLTGAVFPALFEELADRGILLYSLKRHGEVKAVMLSALCFALFHMNLAQTFYTFAMGIITGVLTIKLKNIWPAIIIHFINNAGATLLYFLYVKDLPGKQLYELMDDLSVKAPVVLAAMWMAAIGGSVLLVFAMIRYKRSIDLFNAFKKRGEEYDAKKEAFDSGNIMVDITAEGRRVVGGSGESIEGADDPGNTEDAGERLPDGVERVYKPAFKDKIFFYGILIVAGIATVFSVIWTIM